MARSFPLLLILIISHCVMEIIIRDHKQDNVDHDLRNTASGLEELGKLDDKKQPAQNDCKKGLLVRHNQSDQSCDET